MSNLKNLLLVTLFSIASSAILAGPVGPAPINPAIAGPVGPAPINP